MVALFLASPVNAASYASLVIDAQSGQVLEAKHPDAKRYPASLTKVMTLYMTFEALKKGKLSLHQKLPVSAHAASMPRTNLALKKGTRISVKDAILSLVTHSANDAAVVLAEAIGGSEKNFARLMTAKARKLGMRKTTFRNASGLPNSAQVTTARDMAELGRAMLRDFPREYKYFSKTHFTYKGRKYKNHNKLLKTYTGTDGIKTGYIRALGYNLLASAKRNGRRVIAVMFGGKTSAKRNRHVASLLDKGFKKVMLAGVPKPERAPEPNPWNKVASTALAGLARGEEQIEARENGKFHLLPQANAAVPTGNWGLQVGAFSKAEQARAAAQRTMEKSSVLKTEGAIQIIPLTKSNNKTLYRARFANMTQSAAKKACGELKKNKLDCFVVAP